MRISAGYERLFREAAARLDALGGVCEPDFDFSPFSEVAAMLYQSAFVAERYSGDESVLCSSCFNAN